MSKLVKDMIVRDYASRFEDTDSALLVSIRGISSNDTNAIRMGLMKKEIRVAVVRNSLARNLFKGGPLEPLGGLFKGPSALVFGGESVVEAAREIVGLLKDFPAIELKGAVLDGELFEGEDGVKRLSKFPTRDEAIAQDVTLILSPGRKLVGAIKGPGSRLAGIIKAIEEKLEKGETITAG